MESKSVSPARGATGKSSTKHRTFVKATATADFVPPEVTTMQIYKGIVPFVSIQVFALGLVALFPALTTWLPKAVFGP